MQMFELFPAAKSSASFSCSQFLMELTFLEAVKGTNKDLSANIEDTCPRCIGSGGEPGTKMPLCNYCNGTGIVSCGSGGAILEKVQYPKPLCGS